MKRHPMQLSETEQTLYAELIVHITARMVEIRLAENCINNQRPREDRFDFKDLVIDHTFVSDFERSCRILQKAGVIHPLNNDMTRNDDARAWAAYFQIKFSLSTLHDHLRQHLPDTALPLSQALESFLSLTTNYGGGPPRLSTRRDQFIVPPEYTRTCHLLEQCGYLVHVNNTVQWTDKITPIMQAIYAWDENGASRVEQYEAEINEMWETMPLKIRKRFFSRKHADTVDVITLSDVIARYWYDGKWQKKSHYEFQEDILPNGVVPKAVDLKQKFRESLAANNGEEQR